MLRNVIAVIVWNNVENNVLRNIITFRNGAWTPRSVTTVKNAYLRNSALFGNNMRYIT